MNADKQRIAIAEACGNKWTQADDGWWDGPKGNEGVCYERMLDRLPDYLNDLNAMHEAERVFTSGQHAKFSWMLVQLLDGFNTWKPHEHEMLGVWEMSPHDISACLRAAAAQHAEAFLRTIGKWEDGE